MMRGKYLSQRYEILTANFNLGRVESPIDKVDV